MESKTRLNLVEVAYSGIDYIAYHILLNRISCVTAVVLYCCVLKVKTSVLFVFIQYTFRLNERSKKMRKRQSCRDLNPIFPHMKLFISRLTGDVNIYMNNEQ